MKILSCTGIHFHFYWQTTQRLISHLRVTRASVARELQVLASTELLPVIRKSFGAELLKSLIKSVQITPLRRPDNRLFNYSWTGMCFNLKWRAGLKRIEGINRTQSRHERGILTRWSLCIIIVISKNIIWNKQWAEGFKFVREALWCIHDHIWQWFLIREMIFNYCWPNSITLWKYQLMSNVLSHWGRVTHICVNNLTIIDSDNGLSPGRRQVIIRANAGILLINL